MDQQQSQVRGRSLSAAPAGGGLAHHQPHIRNGHSPSPARFPNPNDDAASYNTNSIGLGLGLVDPSHHQPFPISLSEYPTTPQPDHSAFAAANTESFLNNQQPGLADFSQGFAEQLNKADDPSPFAAHTQESFQSSLLAPAYPDADFSIFPPTPNEPQFNGPLFGADNNGDAVMMSQANHSPTPPHLLNPDPHQPGSANHSPSFNQHQFPTPPGQHSRNASLGPEAAMMSQSINWGQGPQFQRHRRTPSEYSDVSSVAPSPNLLSSDTFEPLDQSHHHSPMVRAQDPGLYQELHGMGSFSISDHGAHSPNHPGRSPSHSPAISPRILPQQLPDLNHPNSYLNSSFGMATYRGPNEAFPMLASDNQDMGGQMPAPPSINIDFAPTATRSGFEQKNLDVDSLVPPVRGMLLAPSLRDLLVCDANSNDGRPEDPATARGHRPLQQQRPYAPRSGGREPISQLRHRLAGSLAVLVASGPLRRVSQQKTTVGIGRSQQRHCTSSRRPQL